MKDINYFTEKLILTDLVVEAKKYSQGLEYTYLEATDSYEVSGIGECTDTDIIIPDTYEGKPITSIGAHALDQCSSLTSVTIGNSVTSIGDYAFDGCRNLTSVTIPNSITSSGYYAFQYCSELKSVYISSIEAWCNIDFSGSMSNPLNNKANLYLNNELLSNFVAPNAVSQIKKYAFYGCISLTSVVISDFVVSIGSSAFEYCLNLINVTIGNAVTSIDYYVFDACLKLNSLTFKDISTWYRTEYSFYWENKTNGTEMNVGSSSTNVTYFTSKYRNHYWYKL